jgi:hypothetical protein
MDYLDVIYGVVLSGLAILVVCFASIVVFATIKTIREFRKDKNK